MKESIEKRLEKVRSLLKSEAFLAGKGLSNEVNIRVFAYDPKDEELAVRYFIEQLPKDSSLECDLHIHNLYEVFLGICDDKRITDKIPKIEETKGSAFLLKQLQNVAKVESFVNKLQYEPHKAGDVLLLHGVGEVYPFMRIHILLEALQAPFSDIPILVFYPGSYSGQDMQLFNRLEKNNYYRAFKAI